MKGRSHSTLHPLATAVACLLLPAVPGMAWAQQAADGEARLQALQAQINDERRALNDMRAALQHRQQNLDALQRALDDEILGNARGRGGAAIAATGAFDLRAQGGTQATEPLASTQPQPVGQAPEADTRPPEVAQIFDQPGVLTPARSFILEPSVQYGYYANDRVALVGYTVIPAILIGLIDVRQVKTTTTVATLTGRYGITNRMEIEAKVPYVYAHSDTVSREIFTGSAQDNVFNAQGKGMGDIEATLRYQINQGAADKPFYIGWLRYKSRTGRDPFEVITDCVTRCVANATGTGLPLDLPTGSGFEAIQPGVTWLFPSDPVVFFGTLSYLHNFKRDNVSRTVLGGQTEFLGEIDAGDIIGLNLGMGLALNEKASISIGYDHNVVDRTQQNGEDLPGSVRLNLGTLLLGGTYRYNEHVSLNVVVGAGLTRDTPDLSLTARIPITF
ncbi:acetate kinase [Marilutibacter aestuarii]|uniref:Acetate kinase n=1 Tax=Marilutibacter aestuarii TaxID=1706195 RepID=A0A508ABL9_9GAMM|nr:acetate kinase [Lysobacter aestuarii]TQD46323.1 acetate kinase [Lysobacter aestuarii]